MTPFQIVGYISSHFVWTMFYCCQVKPHMQVQQYYNLPSYYIFGGFVFVPLTKSYIDDLSLECVLNDEYKITDEQQVIISQVCFSLSTILNPLLSSVPSWILVYCKEWW